MRSCNDMRGSRTDTLLPAPPRDLLDRASLFLDFDGTLVAIAPTPDAVAVEPALIALLSRLEARLDGRLVLVSGRSLADLRALLGDWHGLAAGSHGLETSDEPAEAPPADVAALLSDELAALRRRHPGVLIEAKSHGLALHYRQAPDAEAACRQLGERAAARTGWTVQPGKMVVELRPAGADKGAALRRFMARPAFAGTRPVMIGDDLTDEPAFAAAQNLGGAGVLVGARDTAALYALADVAAVHDWLTEAVAR